MGQHETEQPTQKQAKRDVDALLRGRKDGEVIIKNLKPKVSGGKHEVIDETFRDSAEFKETEQGSIKEWNLPQKQAFWPKKPESVSFWPKFGLFYKINLCLGKINLWIYKINLWSGKD